MADVLAWLQANPLAGRPLDEALGIVRAAGLRPRVLRPGVAMTLEYRPDRITLLPDTRDVVLEARAG